MKKMTTLMITESYFPQDIRVYQEAKLLKDRGYEIIIIALRDKGQIFRENIDGMIVNRIPQIELFKSGRQFMKIRSSIWHKMIIILQAAVGYGFEYLYFTIAAAMLTLPIFIKYKFSVIHTHNPPDTLFLIALFYKIFFRKKFIYDHHDLSPDLFLQKFNNSYMLIYRILLLFEKISCKVADVIIATNESYKKIEIERAGVMPQKIFIVRNGPDVMTIKRTEPIHELRSGYQNILCYLGSINYQDGLQYLLDVLAKLVFKYGKRDILLLIIGDGDYLEIIRQQANQLQITDYICFTGYLTDRKEICRYMSTADVFVDSAPNSFLNDHSTFIKHMEYMVFKKPIVSFALKESAFTLDDAGLFVPPNDTDKMAKAIIELLQNKKMQNHLGENAGRRVQDLTWNKVSIPLVKAYESLKNQELKIIQ